VGCKRSVREIAEEITPQPTASISPDLTLSSTKVRPLESMSRSDAGVVLIYVMLNGLWNLRLEGLPVPKPALGLEITFK
jgi:hypothetical protein